jgi:hypothetical protein
MGRLLLLTIAYFGLGFYARIAADDHPDFSGHWMLDLDHSKFGKMQKPTGMTLVATNDGGTMHAVQTMDSAGGPVTTESNWIPDGKEHDAPGANGGKTVTRWDGNTLYSERHSSDGMFEDKIWMTLSKDGKTATEKVWAHGPDGTNIRTLIWHRP